MESSFPNRCTAEHLRSLCTYSPETGIFYRFDPYTGKLRDTPWGRVNALGYMEVGLSKYGTHKLHRLAWLYVHGTWPVHVIDHINGIKTDNRICNLRDVENTINLQNQHRPHKDSVSGFIGVSPARGRWRADYGGKNLGLYKTPEEAHSRYLAAKSQALQDSCPAIEALRSRMTPTNTSNRPGKETP